MLSITSSTHPLGFPVGSRNVQPQIEAREGWERGGGDSGARYVDCIACGYDRRLNPSFSVTFSLKSVPSHRSPTRARTGNLSLRLALAAVPSEPHLSSASASSPILIVLRSSLSSFPFVSRICLGRSLTSRSLLCAFPQLAGFSYHGLDALARNNSFPQLV